MNIFQALRQDHDKQRQLLEALLETSGDTEERVHLFLALKDELISHAVAEERAFYKPLIMDDMTQEKSRHAIAEHHEIDELIEALEAEDRSSPAWLSTAKKLQAKVLHHLDDEEQEFFQVAGRVLEDKEKSALADEFLEEKRDHMDVES
ncbi:MAG: hemerythrin domain-containing protein [Pseudomonadota bacterium]|nr:hemerythrin domain-containing protein [Pseudomonadota bacterium]